MRAPNPGELISGNTSIQAATSQVFTEVGEEAVILHLKDGVYYGLDPIGTRIWKLIQQPIMIDQLQAILLEEYDVDAEVCRCDLLELLDELSSHNLIEISDEIID